MSGIDECLLEAMAVPGARGAALVEWVSGLALGQAGDAPGGDHEGMAAETAEFARAAAEHPVFAAAEQAAAQAADGEPAPGERESQPPVEDVIVVTGAGYHVLRFVPVPYGDGVFLHLWLDRAQANLALAMLRLRELAERLVLV